jgi:uncharacterized protein
MTGDTSINLSEAADWTQGGRQVVFQQCGACRHSWYFHRAFCPNCGHAGPTTVTATGVGVGIVHAITLVHRAPSDEFRAAAPYLIVLVDAVEGFRMMGHGNLSLAIGDRVRCRIQSIAGRWLPCFEKEPHES